MLQSTIKLSFSFTCIKEDIKAKLTRLGLSSAVRDGYQFIVSLKPWWLCCCGLYSLSSTPEFTMTSHLFKTTLIKFYYFLPIKLYLPFWSLVHLGISLVVYSFMNEGTVGLVRRIPEVAIRCYLVRICQTVL